MNARDARDGQMNARDARDGRIIARDGRMKARDARNGSRYPRFFCAKKYYILIV